MGEAIWKGISSPSHYNAIDLNKVKERSMSPNLKTKLVRFPPSKKVDLGPSLYKPSESLTTHKNPNYSTDKSPKVNFIAKYTKLKNFVPSPNTYHPELADRIMTKGLGKSYK